MTSTPRPTTDSSSDATSQSDPAKIRVYKVCTGQVFDPIARVMLPREVVWVDRESGIVIRVGEGAGQIEEDLMFGSEFEVEVTDVDLTNLTVLPGFVDVHVHLFLHPYAETPWGDQLTKESLAERTIRATVHAKETLLAGFTTVRDLGTEGALDADVALRRCLAGKDAIIPGPRYYCATRAIVSSGAYGPRNMLHPAQEGIDGVKGAEVADGVDDCVREVRRQIGAGADWIKIYADYPTRSRLSQISPSFATRSMPTFNRTELSALISTAHASGVKVAAHANTPSAIRTVLDLGIDSIEHGCEMYNGVDGDTGLLEWMRRGGVEGKAVWVPTLAAYWTSAMNNPGNEGMRKRWERCVGSFKEAMKLRRRRDTSGGDGGGKEEERGLENLACGGDTGVFAHGQNALEMVLMRKLGAPWERVLSWATYGGWKCVRGMNWEGFEGERRLEMAEKRALEFARDGISPDKMHLERDTPFGVLRVGWAADLVAVEGKLDGSPQEFEDALMRGVKFVMKGGRIYLKDGQELVNDFED